MNIIDVAAGLIFRQGRLLITQRQAQTHLGGLWEFPGGKREPGETFEQCLTRELFEELGIEISVGSLFESLTHAYPEKAVRLNFYRCDLLRGEPQSLGCADFKWVRADQLRDFQFPPADERLLDKLQSDTSLWKH
jgi:8-oxo-dGTP diphosphatase